MSDQPNATPMSIQIINLTPQTINLFERQDYASGETVPRQVRTFESSGSLNMLTDPPLMLPNLRILNTEDNSVLSFPCSKNPNFLCPDKNGAAYKLLTEYTGPPALFLVTLPVGQYFVEHSELIPAGCHVGGPDTGPAHVLREGGNIKGTFNILTYASSTKKE
jgi:hypothetical protein